MKLSATILPVIGGTVVIHVRGSCQRAEWGDSPKVAPWHNEDVTPGADALRHEGLGRATALPPHAHALTPTASQKCSP